MRQLMIMGLLVVLSSLAEAHDTSSDFDLDALFAGEAFVLSGQATGTQFMGEQISVIDMHLHSGTFENMGPLGQEFILDSIPLPLPEAQKRVIASLVAQMTRQPYAPYSGIKNECLKAGLQHCVLYAVYTPETWGIEENNTIIDYLEDPRNRVNGEPYFLGFASLSQVEWEQQGTAQIAALRESLSHPLMVGIKLAFAHNVEPLDDPKWDAIYELARDLDVPLYHHIGTSPLRRLEDFQDDEQRERYRRSFDPTYLEGAIQRFPSVRFILGHMGFDFNGEGVGRVDEVFRLAQIYPNVYLELSAFGGETYDPDGTIMVDILTRAKALGLVERLLYGSDGPGIPNMLKRYKDRTLSALEAAGYTIPEARAVMAGNFVSVTRLPERIAAAEPEPLVCSGDDGLLDPGVAGRADVDTEVFRARLGSGSKTRFTTISVSLPEAADGAAPVPVILVSPGFQLDRDLYASYPIHLASWGYAALVTEKLQLGISHAAMTRRLRDVLSWLVDEESRPESPLHGRLDLSKIGLAGHSLGGKISFMLGIDLIEDDDERVQAIFAIDPVDDGKGSPSVTPEQMAKVDMPFIALGETLDSTPKHDSLMACAPEASNFEKFFDGARSPAAKIDVLGASHMSFLDNPNCRLFCSVCREGAIGSGEARKLARRYMTAFYNIQLKGEVEYETFLCGACREQDVNENRITFATTNSLCPTE
ncbi:amidohydrolase family protein [Thiocapsa marina]|nr:amidohydrolase family protein [Thiocapsa marina]